MGKLGCSESNFRQNCKHTVPYVIGMYGNNIKANDFPFDPHTERGNIWNAAWYLKHCLALGDGNYKEALTHYKGYCALGRAQANAVLKIQPKDYRE